jgi:hypothetical protein
MSIEPAYGMIAPGGSATVSVTVHVDDAVARDISLGRELAFAPSGSAAAATARAIPPSTGVNVSPAAVGGLLEDVLILRMERGRDYYLSVSAAVLPTCFGCSLAQLARRPEPMRGLVLTSAAASALNAAAGAIVGAQQSATAGKLPNIPDLSAGSHQLASLLSSDDADLTDMDGAAGKSDLTSSDASRKGSTLMSVPKEIWRLVDLLFSRGMDNRGVFLAPGDVADIIQLRECLDTGEGFPADVDMLSVAEVLLDLLESLREPVIPTALFPGADVKTVPVEALASQILRSLTPLHYNVLVYMIRFGREILSHASTNGASVDDLAYVFSRCLMRRIPHDEAPAHAPLGDGMGSVPATNVISTSNREDEEAGAALARASLFADKGTRWEPSRDEQEIMSKLFVFYLTSAPLA